MPFYNSMISTLRVFRHSAAVMFAATMTFSAAFAAPVVKTFIPPSRNEVLIRQYLYEAEDALAHGRLIAPKNDNAYAGYQRALALDPHNEKARAGVRQIGSRYLSMAKKAEADNDFEHALTYARQAQRMAPGDGPAQLVKDLQQRQDEYEKQQTQIAKSGAGGVKAPLKSKGNEYFLAAGDVSRRNLTAKSQLAQIAEKAQALDSRIQIVAKNDGDGRWIYTQMRDSLATDYRLRANISVDSQAKIVLLDQPPEGAAAPANTATTASAAVAPAAILPTAVLPSGSTPATTPTPSAEGPHQ